MNYTGFTQGFSGIKVFTDPNCYTEKRVWRAVAVVVDVRRPNKVKPIYKKKLFITRTPRAYMVKGMGLIAHPDIIRRIQEQMAQDIDKQMRSYFGLNGPAAPASTLTMADLEKAFRLMK